MINGSATVDASDSCSGRLDGTVAGAAIGRKVFSVKSRRIHRAPVGITTVPSNPPEKAAYRPSSLRTTEDTANGAGVPSGVELMIVVRPVTRSLR
jgi:hypothetical protein